MKGDTAPWCAVRATTSSNPYARHFGEVLVPASVQCRGYDTPGGFGVEPADNGAAGATLPPKPAAGSGVADRPAPEVLQREYHGVLVVDFRPTARGAFHAGKRSRAQPNTCIG